MYLSKVQLALEIVTEFLLLFVSVLMQQFMVLYSEKTLESIQMMTFILMGVLVLLNLNILLHACLVNCKISRRLKKQQKDYRSKQDAINRRKMIKRELGLASNTEKEDISASDSNEAEKRVNTPIPDVDEAESISSSNQSSS